MRLSGEIEADDSGDPMDRESIARRERWRNNFAIFQALPVPRSQRGGCTDKYFYGGALVVPRCPGDPDKRCRSG